MKAEELKLPTKVSTILLKQELKPLLKFKQQIETIYVYGSCISCNDPNDIDVLIIIDDTQKISPNINQEIEKTCGLIEFNGKQKGLQFHFQPLKNLSKWWNLIIEGEPWIISSLKHVFVFYSKTKLVYEIRNFIKKQILYRREEKAEKLIERSDKLFIKNRSLLLSSISTLVNAGTEAAQILLLFDGKLILNKRKISEELRKNHKNLGQELIDDYSELVDLEEKMEKGALSEFSSENLDYYKSKIQRFIGKVETLLVKK